MLTINRLGIMYENITSNIKKLSSIIDIDKFLEKLSKLDKKKLNLIEDGYSSLLDEVIEFIIEDEKSAEVGVLKTFICGALITDFEPVSLGRLQIVASDLGKEYYIEYIEKIYYEQRKLDKLREFIEDNADDIDGVDDIELISYVDILEYYMKDDCYETATYDLLDTFRDTRDMSIINGLYELVKDKKLQDKVDELYNIGWC